MKRNEAYRVHGLEIIRCRLADQDPSREGTDWFRSEEDARDRLEELDALWAWNTGNRQVGVSSQTIEEILRSM